MQRPYMSQAQLDAINIELDALAAGKANDGAQTGWGTSKPHDAAILYSNYTTDVFIRYFRYESDGTDTGKQTYYIRISFEGRVDCEPLKTMYFQTVADRIHFFNTLQELR